MPAPLPVDGPAAPPRSNGELVFAEPWEGRAFGMAVALHDAGAFAWETFQSALIAHLQAGEPQGRGYYECWLAALEDVLAATGRVRRPEVEARTATFASRPAGHDHGDGHEHGHGH
ncbi:nitrile hydratase accessory protein [Actinomycetes bacterium KLBMP 9759]